jgi:acetyl-CoA/propionyl-CoA carboxylase biotin carboxyl carrier protein
VLPFHRAVVRDPAFTAEPFTIHTRWIETEFAQQLPSFSSAAAGQETEPPPRQRITVEVGGKRLDVVLPADLLPTGLLEADPAAAGWPGGTPTQAGRPGSGRAAGRGRRAQRGRAGGTGPGGGTAAGSAAGPGAGSGSGSPASRAGADDLVSPMQGTIIKIIAGEGERVAAGDTVVVLEAMKMEQPLTAHKDGTVTGLAVEIGQTVPAGGIVCQLKD